MDAVELHTFVPITDEAGIMLAGTYNPVSAAAQHPPWKWRFYGFVAAERPIARIAPSLTEPQLDARLERKVLDYVGAHPLAPLEIAADNTLRLLELEGSAAWRASAASIGIPLGFARIAVVSLWVLALLAAAGLFARPVGSLPRWLCGVPALLWLSVVLVNAETPRFREPLEPFLVMLAACGLASIAGRGISRSRSAASRVLTPPATAATRYSPAGGRPPSSRSTTSWTGTDSPPIVTDASVAAFCWSSTATSLSSLRLACSLQTIRDQAGPPPPR